MMGLFKRYQSTLKRGLTPVGWQQRHCPSQVGILPKESMHRLPFFHEAISLSQWKGAVLGAYSLLKMIRVPLQMVPFDWRRGSIPQRSPQGHYISCGVPKKGPQGLFQGLFLSLYYNIVYQTICLQALSYLILQVAGTMQVPLMSDEWCQFIPSTGAMQVL